MIIQCPNCSTGFNLPDQHITPKGAKLRCSRCSYVFRVRRSSAEADIELFYKPEDERANEELFAAEGALDASGSQQGVGEQRSQVIDLGEDFEALLGAESGASTSRAPVAAATPQTQIGMPSISKNPEAPDLSGYGFGSSKRSSAEIEDPFPLAGASAKGLKAKIKIDIPRPATTPSSPRALSGQSMTKEMPETPPEGIEASLDEVSSPTEGIDLFGDELDPSELHEEDPFAGAFEDDDELDPHSMAEEVSAPSPAQAPPILTPGQPVALSDLNQQLIAASANQEAAPPQPALTPGGLRGASSGGAMHQMGAEDLVDPDFGAGGASFDPEQGVIEPSAPRSPAVQPAAQQAAQPGGRRPEAQPRAAARPATVAATKPPAAKPVARDYEDAWPTQADALAAHRIGGGGAQKAANLALIVALVFGGFLALVALLNDGLLDFKQFGSMIEVAFSDGTYSPRQEWLPKPKPAPQVALEAPLRTESVWAEVVPYGKRDQERALLVRGLLRNFDKRAYQGVTLRGVILNGKEKIIAERTAPLGASISNGQIAAVSELSELEALQPAKPSELSSASSEPFSIVFEELPREVLDGEPVFFRVDVVERSVEGGE